MPALVAAVSGAGLMLGLLGDGWYDIAAWAGLGLPLAAIAWSLAGARR